MRYASFLLRKSRGVSVVELLRIEVSGSLPTVTPLILASVSIIESLLEFLLRNDSLSLEL